MAGKRWRFKSGLSFPPYHYVTKFVEGCMVPHISCHPSSLPALLSYFHIGSLPVSFSFCLHPFSIHSSCFFLTGAARVSCTWSSPSVKMASTYWDRTALPLTRSQKSLTSTPHTNSQSVVQSTSPCCSPCWCRRSDWPWRSSWTSRIYLQDWHVKLECPTWIFPVECHFSLLVGLDYWFNTPGANALNHHCCCTCAMSL